MFRLKTCLVFEENLVLGMDHECEYVSITTDPYRLKVNPFFIGRKYPSTFPNRWQSLGAFLLGLANGLVSWGKVR